MGPDLAERYSNIVAILWEKRPPSDADGISALLFRVDAICLRCGFQDKKNRRQHEPCRQCKFTLDGKTNGPIMGSLGPAF